MNINHIEVSSGFSLKICIESITLLCRIIKEKKVPISIYRIQYLPRNNIILGLRNRITHTINDSLIYNRVIYNGLSFAEIILVLILVFNSKHISRTYILCDFAVYQRVVDVKL